MKRIVLLGICLISCAVAWAQVTLTATTDKTDLMLDDELTLTVKVTGAQGNMVMPQLPSLPAFNVYSQGAESITINGKSSFVFRYTMMPRFVGNTTIGPITFKYGGRTYQTKPISIRIYRSGGAANNTAQTTAVRNTQVPYNTQIEQLPPLEKELATRAYAHQNEPYFVISAVSNKTPYVNEPFVLAVRFYYSQAFYDAPYQNPSVSNLFMEEQAGSQGQQTINGRTYRYEEKRYLLSGVSAGKASIGAASVSFRVGDSPLSVLDRFFGGSAVQPQQTVQSKPISLTIEPFPTAGKPNSFYGAVGTGFTFSAKLDRSTTQAGEAVTWSAVVQGPGNLKTTSDLHFPAIEGVSAYAAAPVADYLPQNKNRSYKLFKTELVPSASGTYTLPALAWSYLDPQTRTYKTLLSKPLTLTVTPATQTQKQVSFNAEDGAPTGIQTLGKDIRYVISDPAPQASWLVVLPSWKWAHIALFCWLAVCVLIASIGKKTAARKHAYLTAKNHLKKATAYENISDTLSMYLQNKWHISTGSLPLKDILQALASKHVPANISAEFATLWKELESARFAPLQGDTNTLDQFKERVAQLLKKLEGTK